MVGSSADTGTVPSTWTGYVYTDVSAPQQPVLEEGDEELLRTYSEVSLVLGDQSEQGLGTLYVTSRRVVWISVDNPSLGYAVPFRDIAMHAVSSDLASFPRPCIYAQLQGGFDDEDGGYGDDEAAAEVPSEDAVSLEMRLTPVDATALEDMFKTFCDAAAMNPDDEDDELGGAEGEGEFFYDEEEVMAGVDPQVREQMLRRYDGLLVEPNDEEDEASGEGADEARFEDPDDEEGAAGAALQPQPGGSANGHG